MAIVRYPGSGFFRPGTIVQHEQEDQGHDMALRPSQEVQAPGRGVCVRVLSDRPFPNGFGPDYPIIRIFDGVFGGHDWYLGHCSTRVREGEAFGFGHLLAVADQGHNWAGTTGGWIELGEAFDGLPERDQPGAHWYDNALRRDLVIRHPDPPLAIDQRVVHNAVTSGFRVLGMTSRLRDCGYLSRPWWKFTREVHGAVVQFKTHHHLPRPRPDGGIVDSRTDAALKLASDWCKKHHRKEVT